MIKISVKPRDYYKEREKKEKIKAFFYILLTIIIFAGIYKLGLPIIAKTSLILSELKKRAEIPERDDITPPAPPELETVPDFTNKSEVTISGYSEPGSTITVTLNEQKTELLADKEGKFKVNLTLSLGKNILYVKAKDQQGNESQESKHYEIFLDTTPPEITIKKPEDRSRFFGAREKQITIEGQTESSATLFINERLIGVDEEGNFFYLTTLNEGENNFKLKAKDKAGNETQKELTLFYSQY